MDSEPGIDLAVQAALLYRFAEADLLALLPESAPAIAALLTSEGVLAVGDRPGVVTLTDAARQEALARLRARGPRAEIDLRLRAFRAFLERMVGAQADADTSAEDHVFDQLRQLFVLLYLRLEWRAISDLLDELRVASPRRPQHLQRIQLYRAFVAVRTGDYAVGARLIDELLTAKSLEPYVHIEAVLALGHLHRYMTRYDLALETYEALAQLARETEQPIYLGVALFNLGTVYNELEQHERALDLVLQAEAVFAAHDDRDRLAYACYSAGLNAMYLGRWQFAREQYARAIQLFEQLGMETTLATCHWGQGLLALLLGDFAASEQAYLRAIQISTTDGRGDLYLALDSWADLGFLYFAQGRPEAALPCYAEGLALSRQLDHDHRGSFIHYLQARALAELGRADEATAAYDEAMAAVEALKNAQQEEAVKIGVLGTAQQVYEAAALHALARGQQAEAFAVVERACSRALLDSLAARAPELFARYAHPTIGLAEAQAALPEGALLLVYFTSGVKPAGEHFYHTIPAENVAVKERLLLPPGVILFAVTSTSLAVHHLNLDPNILAPQEDDPRPGRHLVHERRLAALYERLLGRVEAQIADCSSLFIVPHGPLHYVPFMALRSSAGLHLVRAGGPAVALAPSATVLVRNCLGREPVDGGGALAVGYNGAGGGSLRFAEPEARMVAHLMGGRALTGEAARAEALLSAGPLRGLHIAGHAAFRPDDPLESALALAGGERLSARAIMGGAGLRADLVVLSACTSGLSQVARGDELLGLQRAWLYAGAAAVVCALWEAGDLVTLLVMERFYAHLAAGAPPGGALRDAVVAVRTLTGRELQSIFARWRLEDPALAEPGALPVLPAELDELAVYAAPIHWAPFMLIGRP